MSKQFLLSEWIETNIPKKYRRRGLLIWEDCPYDVIERVREAFNIGVEIERDKVINEIRDLEATVTGLTDALEAKNETVVHIKQANWPVVTLILVLIGLEVWRFYNV